VSSSRPRRTPSPELDTLVNRRDRLGGVIHEYERAA
jgi:hypothetical protein